MRVTLAFQQLALRAGALLMSLCLGLYLVAWAADPPPMIWNAAALILLVGSVAVHLHRRLRRLNPAQTVRLDLELFTHLCTLVYLAILHSPGRLDGAAYPLLYAFVMLVAGFARPSAAVGTLVYAILLEAGLRYVAFGEPNGHRLFYHAGLMGVFAFLNLVLIRAEIVRMRKLSRLRIESEMLKMRESARSYRLLTAPASSHGRGVRSDEERLLRSGVDEIHQALEFALSLLRRSLGLKTAIVLGLDSSRSTLRVQELSTDEDALQPGPFSAKDGIFAATLAREAPVSIVGPRAEAHARYYATPVAVGAVLAVPIIEHQHTRGVLVVDRAAATAFSEEEQETLLAATHFLVRVVENERVFLQMERAKMEQGKLYRAVEALAAATTEAEVIEAGVHSASEFTVFDFAGVTLYDPDTRTHEICAISGEGAEALVGQRFRHNSGLVSMVVANRHALPYRGQYDPKRQVVFTRTLGPPECPSLLVLPLVVHERALGTLILGSQRTHAFSDSVRTTLEVLASHVAVSLANARMLKRLEDLATTDGLTELYNKRALTDAAVQKLRSAKRFGKSLSLLVCDIDHFKRVNDTYGHDMGDVVIRGLADILKRVKRDIDLVGRFGGEEFVVVCEQTNSEGARLLAERIRQELSTTVFHTELGPLKVTCSVGVATFPGAADRWETLFKASDEALYVSKRLGRDRVTVWTPKMQGCAA